MSTKSFWKPVFAVQIKPKYKWLKKLEKFSIAFSIFAPTLKKLTLTIKK